MSSGTDNLPPRFEIEIEDFLLERRIRKVSPKTLAWHKSCLTRFARFCCTHHATSTQQINAKIYRQFIVHLEETGHNEGGVANICRSVKAYFNWFEVEYDDLDWKNPAKKVKVKNPTGEPLEPLSTQDFQKMLATCERKTLTGERDRAALMTLLDTGIRKAEIAELRVADLDLKTGSVAIRRGKGGKSRTVYLGAQARRAMIAYLRQREKFLTYLQRTYKQTPTDYLWINGTDGKRLRYDSIHQIVRRRAADAGIKDPAMHAFRRAFARNAWLAGMDLLAIQRLLGHSTLAVINRYIKSFNDDLQQIHQQYSPVDNL